MLWLAPCRSSLAIRLGSETRSKVRPDAWYDSVSATSWSLPLTFWTDMKSVGGGRGINLASRSPAVQPPWSYRIERQIRRCRLPEGLGAGGLAGRLFNTFTLERLAAGPSRNRAAIGHIGISEGRAAISRPGAIGCGPMSAILRVTSTNDRYAVCQIAREDLVSFDANPVPDADFDHSGWSGAPALLFGTHSYPIIGVVSEYQPALQLLFIATMESAMLQEA